MTQLYKLADQYRFLEQAVERGEGDEDTGDTQLQLDLADLKEKIEDKVENIGKFILSLEADTTGIKAEEERLSSRRVAIVNRVRWLKDYLLQEMTVAQVDKVKRDVLTVSVRTSPPSVNVLDMDAIPEQFRRVIPEKWEVDKKEMIANFKGTGEIPAGTEIITNKKSIVIR